MTGLLLAALTLVVAVLAVLVVGLLRSHAEILRQLHALGAGTGEPGTGDRRNAEGIARARAVTRDEVNPFPGVPAPGEDEGFPEGRDLVGTGLAEDAVSIRVTGVDHPTLVAFLSSGCLTCQRFWDAFARPAALGLAPGTRLVIVTKGPGEESPARIADLAPDEVPLVMSSEAWESYRVPGSPYFVLVDGPTGAVTGEGTGIDWPQVRGLLTQVADDAALEAQRVRKPRGDDERERRVDAELWAAGVRPGDPSLYEVPPDEVPPDEVPPDEVPPEDHEHSHEHDDDHGRREAR